MRTQIGLLSIAGFFGLPAQADAHTPSASTAGRTFDGTYQLASSAKVNPMSTSSKGDMAPFSDRTPGALTIAQGQARYATRTGYELQGPVGPNGELDMRLMNVGGGGSRSLEIRTTAAQNRPHWHGSRPTDWWCLQL
jgi:hypothetical protein